MWETIDRYTHRMKVPGGWIVKSFLKDFRICLSPCSVHQIFIADAEHEWKLEKK